MFAFLRRKFPGGVARLVGMFEYVFERFKGVDFRHEKVCVTDNRVNYGPALWYALRAIKNYLRDKVTPNDSVIDIGCGKGKILYFFSKFPFRKIGGLEYEQRLVDIAERNMQKLLTRGGGSSVEIVQGDAAVYKDYDDYNYFYLYNPFTDVIMRPFLENVKESVSRRPRKIRLIYLHPVYTELITIEEGFRLEKELRFIGYPRECFVYSYEIA